MNQRACKMTMNLMFLVMLLLASLVFGPLAFADEAQQETAISPRTSKDYYYTFKFDLPNSTYAAPAGWKDDATPSYVLVNNMTIYDVYLYIDGLSNGTWTNRTVGGYAYLVDPGAWWIHNTVYESGDTSARLTGWSPDEAGVVGGQWSADSIYTYPSLN